MRPPEPCRRNTFTKRTWAIGALVITTAVASSCGGSNAPPPQPERSPPKTSTAPVPSRTPGAGHRAKDSQISAALNRIVAECERRRKAGASKRRIEGVSREFRRSVDVLIEAFEKAPDERLVLRSGQRPTTARHIRQRVAAALRRPAPVGSRCATDWTRHRETAPENRRDPRRGLSTRVRRAAAR